MTPSGNHTLAILNGTESYDRLKVALEYIITEVYNLQGRLNYYSKSGARMCRENYQ